MTAVLLSIVLTDRDKADLVFGYVLPGLLVLTTVVAVPCMVIASIRRTVTLRRGGGSAVVTELGGVPVPPDTTDPALRRLQSAGLVEALKKIAALPAGSTVDNARSEEVSHMLFGERTRTHSRFATHPPLVQRIRALDPTFNPAVLTRLIAHWKANPPSGAKEDRTLGRTDPATQRDPQPTAQPTHTPEPAALTEPQTAAEIAPTTQRAKPPTGAEATAPNLHEPPPLTEPRPQRRLPQPPSEPNRQRTPKQPHQTSMNRHR